VSLFDNIISCKNNACGLEKASENEKSKKIDVVFPVLHGCNGEDGPSRDFLNWRAFLMWAAVCWLQQSEWIRFMQR